MSNFEKFVKIFKLLRCVPRKESAPELNKCQYSLVSCGELTSEAVQLWLGLPEEVKYDPALAAFRQLYDNERGKEEIPIKSNENAEPKTDLLPVDKSAPPVRTNLQIISENVSLSSIGKEQESTKAQGSQELHQDEQPLMGPLQKKQTKKEKAKYFTKMTLLILCWIFFTIVFLIYNEKEDIVMNTSLAPGEVKTYVLTKSASKLSILVKLSGPFLSEEDVKLNASHLQLINTMQVALERSSMKSLRNEDDMLRKKESDNWVIGLLDDEKLDFSEGEPRSTILSLEEKDSKQIFTYALRMSTTSNKTTPFTLNYMLNPLDLTSGVIYACLLLCGLYVLIISEMINRTLAAILVSTSALAVLALIGERPSVEEIVSWLDVETLLLLFSMMVLVAIMAETGMFDYLAVYTFEVAKGKLWPLITLLSITTAVLSSFLDNVTTILLMAPVTIKLCEVMNLDPIPILMAMVIFSNIGGTATPVGDPPNIIIASNKAVIQSGINFAEFTMHMLFGVLLVGVQTYFQYRFMFRDSNKFRLKVRRDVQEIRNQSATLRRATDSLPQLSQGQVIVRKKLEQNISKLKLQLSTMTKESGTKSVPKQSYQSTLNELKSKYKIRDKVLLIKASIAVVFVVIMFFLHSVPTFNKLSLGWTALLGAILLLVLADREDLEPILHRVEWSTLLFFAALFVLMEALAKLGLIELIGNVTENIILQVDEKHRLAAALLLMLWVSGIISAFVDNIPLTTMMIRVVTSLGLKPSLNLPLSPLIWALSFGACLGGNGTLIGASANVVCAGVAEQHGYKMTFVQFFKIGFPLMLGQLTVASGYLIMCHCVFTWH